MQTRSKPAGITVRVPNPDVFKPHRWMVESLNDPHRFKVHRWHRRARKTTLAINKLIKAAVFSKNETFAYIAPTYKQAKSIIVRDPMMLNRYMPKELLSKPFNETELYAQFISGSVLQILGADDPDSLRGKRFKGVVLDEFALMKREVFDEILSPVLRESGGWCDFYFTPKGRNHAYEFHRRGGLQGYDDWASFDLPVSKSNLLTADQIATARQEMGDELFRQEMECEFLEDMQAVFRGLDRCIYGEPESGAAYGRYIIGIDLGRVHDATVITVIDAAKRHVVAVERLTDNNWAAQKLAIASMAHRYNGLIYCEDNSFGSPIVEDLREMGLSVEGFTTTSTSKHSIIDGLRVAIAQRLITIPKHFAQTIQELRDYEYKLPKDGTIDPSRLRYGAPEGEGFFDDCVMSLALAVHGLKSDVYVPRYEMEMEYHSVIADIPANQGFTFATR
jgi:hypothetical protein